MSATVYQLSKRNTMSYADVDDDVPIERQSMDEMESIIAHLREQLTLEKERRQKINKDVFSMREKVEQYAEIEKAAQEKDIVIEELQEQIEDLRRENEYLQDLIKEHSDDESKTLLGKHLELQKQYDTLKETYNALNEEMQAMSVAYTALVSESELNAKLLQQHEESLRVMEVQMNEYRREISQLRFAKECAIGDKEEAQEEANEWKRKWESATKQERSLRDEVARFTNLLAAAKAEESSEAVDAISTQTASRNEETRTRANSELSLTYSIDDLAGELVFPDDEILNSGNNTPNMNKLEVELEKLKREKEQMEQWIDSICKEHCLTYSPPAMDSLTDGMCSVSPLSPQTSTAGVFSSSFLSESAKALTYGKGPIVPNSPTSASKVGFKADSAHAKDDSADTRIQELNAKVASLESEVLKLESSLRNEQNKKTELHAQIAEHKEDIQRYKSEIAALQETSANYKDLHSNYEEAKRTFARQEAEYVQQIEDLRTQLSSYVKHHSKPPSPIIPPAKIPLSPDLQSNAHFHSPISSTSPFLSGIDLVGSPTVSPSHIENFTPLDAFRMTSSSNNAIQTLQKRCTQLEYELEVANQALAKTKQDSESRVNLANEEVQKLKELSQSLSKQLAECNQLLVTAESRIRILETTVEGVEEEKVVLRASLKAVQKSLANEQQQLAQTETALQSSKHQQGVLNQRITEAEDEITELKRKCSTLQKSLNQAKDTIDDLESDMLRNAKRMRELQQEAKELQSVQTNLELMEAKYSECSKKCAMLTKQLEDAHRLNADFENKAKSSEEKGSGYEKLLASMRSDIETLTNEKMVSNTRIVQLEITLRETDKMKESLMENMERLNASIATHKQRISELQASVQSKTEELEQKESESAIDRAKIEKLLRNLETLSEEKDSLISDVNSLKERIEAQATEDSEALNTEKKKSADILAVRVQELQEEHKTYIATLTNGHERVVASITSKCESELEQLRKDHSDVITTLKDGHAAVMKQATSEHASRMEQLTAEHSALVEKLTIEHALSLEKLKGEHSEELATKQKLHQDECDAIKAEAESRSAEIESRLSAQLRTEKAESEARLAALKQDLEDTKQKLMDAQMLELQSIQAAHKALLESVQHEFNAERASWDETARSHSELLSQLEAQTKTVIESLESQYTAKLKAEEDKFEACSAVLEQEHQERIAEIKAEHEKEMENAKNLFKKRIDDINATHENVVQQLQHQISSLTTDVEIRQEEITTLEKQINNKNNRIDALQEEVDHLRIVETAYKEAKDTIQNLEQQLEEAAASMDQVRQELEDAYKVRDELIDALNSMREQVRLLQESAANDISALQQHVLQLQNELVQTHDTHEIQIKVVHEAAQQLIQEEREKNEKWRESKVEEQTQYKLMLEEKKRQEIEEFRAKTKLETDELRGIIAGLTSQSKVYTDQMADLAKQLTNSLYTIEVASTSAKSTTDALVVAQREKEGADHRAISLQSEIEFVTKQMEEIIDKYSALVEKLQNVEAEKAVLEEDNHLMHRHLRIIEEKVSIMLDEVALNATYKATAKALQKDMSTLRAERDHLATKLDRVQSRYERLTHRLEKISGALIASKTEAITYKQLTETALQIQGSNRGALTYPVEFSQLPNANSSSILHSSQIHSSVSPLKPVQTKLHEREAVKAEMFAILGDVEGQRPSNPKELTSPSSGTSVSQISPLTPSDAFSVSSASNAGAISPHRNFSSKPHSNSSRTTSDKRSGSHSSKADSYAIDLNASTDSVDPIQAARSVLDLVADISQRKPNMDSIANLRKTLRVPGVSAVLAKKEMERKIETNYELEHLKEQLAMLKKAQQRRLLAEREKKLSQTRIFAETASLYSNLETASPPMPPKAPTTAPGASLSNYGVHSPSQLSSRLASRRNSNASATSDAKYSIRSKSQGSIPPPRTPLGTEPSSGQITYPILPASNASAASAASLPSSAVTSSYKNASYSLDSLHHTAAPGSASISRFSFAEDRPVTLFATELLDATSRPLALGVTTGAASVVPGDSKGRSDSITSEFSRVGSIKSTMSQSVAYPTFSTNVQNVSAPTNTYPAVNVNSVPATPTDAEMTGFVTPTTRAGRFTRMLERKDSFQSVNSVQSVHSMRSINSLHISQTADRSHASSVGSILPQPSAPDTVAVPTRRSLSNHAAKTMLAEPQKTPTNLTSATPSTGAQEE